MALSNRFLMGCASLSMVLAIGYIMETYSQPPLQASVLPPQTDVIAGAGPLEISQIALTAAATPLAPTPPVAGVPTLAADDPFVVRVAAASGLPEVPAQDMLSVPTLQCDPAFSATALPGAVVNLVFEASCLPQHRVTFHHNGLMFTQQSDNAGRISVKVPALVEAAVFIADAGDGIGAVAQARVADLALFDRAIAQWQGNQAVQLHALEFGASHGEAGHVWRDAPGEFTAANPGGFTLKLGDPELPNSYQAMVYSYPTATSQRAGNIALSVEAEVTAANCNRDVLAETLQVSAGRGLVSHELLLAMPECDAIGDFLLLNNLLQDLTIAAK